MVYDYQGTAPLKDKGPDEGGKIGSRRVKTSKEKKTNREGHRRISVPPYW